MAGTPDSGNSAFEANIDQLDVNTDDLESLTQAVRDRVGALSDAAVTNPSSNASLVAALKGIITLLVAANTSLTTLTSDEALAATQTTLAAVLSALNTVDAHVDGLESLITTTNSALNTIDAHVDGLEGLVAATNTALATLAGYTDGLEGLVTSSNTKLDTIGTYVDGLEGLITTLNTYVDGLEALITSSNTKLDTLGTYVDGLESLATTLNGYVDGLEGLLGTKTLAGTGELQGVTSATQLPNVACSLVKFKARWSNAGSVYLGGSGVTKVDGTTDTTTGIELAAGEESGWVPIANLNALYRICDNTGDALTYMALS